LGGNDKLLNRIHTALRDSSDLLNLSSHYYSGDRL
jgi:hypothetical protein